jgi:hypothetical protein
MHSIGAGFSHESYGFKAGLEIVMGRTNATWSRICDWRRRVSSLFAANGSACIPEESEKCLIFLARAMARGNAKSLP